MVRIAIKLLTSVFFYKIKKMSFESNRHEVQIPTKELTRPTKNVNISIERESPLFYFADGRTQIRIAGI
jgi:hypothetical protein